MKPFPQVFNRSETVDRPVNDINGEIFAEIFEVLPPDTKGAIYLMMMNALMDEQQS